MLPGTLFAGRFEIERLAGDGGMAKVYRARDTVGDRAVAVKVMHEQHPESARRFAREARLLSEIPHPRIVEYVAHGVSDDGRLYLAMEWLEGEDLAKHILHSRLDVGASLLVARQVAEALAPAHARGIVHRDIKPSNLFLVQGDLERLKVLDFGIARVAAPTVATAQGAILGTPGYMSPEQVRADVTLDARVDVFALGVVLFELLAGRHLFIGERVMAIFAKILFEEIPRVRAFAPSVPAAVDDLVARMLSRKIDERPVDAAAVLALLDEVELPVGPSFAHVQATPTPALGTRERRLVWIVFVAGEEAPGTGRPVLEQVSENLGLELQWLVDGSAVLSLTAAGAATDSAVRAARAALEVQRAVPHACIAVATGHAVLDGVDSVGEAIDRAAALLGPPGIQIDDVTAGLIEARFEVEGGRLLGERHEPSGGRILGRPTPFVGREGELALVRATYDECVGEPQARVVVVTAPAGVGKSRFARELLEELGRRSPAPQIWRAQADEVGAGAPFRMLSQVVRMALGLRFTEAANEREARVLQRLVATPDPPRVASFLGQIADVTLIGQEAPAVQAARGDAVVRGDQMSRAFEEFVEQETVAAPVVIVLEDLHWGDAPTISVIDSALRILRDRPLFVLALARPEVDEKFPRLWADRKPLRIELRELGRQAAASLIRGLLSDVGDDRLSLIIERAGGNALYLEELIRAEVLGTGERAPDTVLAMVQARLEALTAELRQILRAASVFGRAFWLSGVAKLLGGVVSGRVIAERLAELEGREVVARIGERRYAGEDEWTFRHALVRDAAYRTLTQRDHVLGHRLAAEWIEERGPVDDPVVLAEHHEEGGEPLRAVTYWRAAAELALSGNDLSGVIARSARAIHCGASGEELGGLHELSAQALWWQGEYGAAEELAQCALGLAGVGSAAWHSALGTAASANMVLGRRGAVVELGRTLAAHDPEPDQFVSYLRAAARVAPLLFNSGETIVARSLMDSMLRVSERAERDDPATLARVLFAWAVRAKSEGDPARYLVHTEAAVAAAGLAGDRRYECMQQINAGYALLELGQSARAESRLRAALATATRLALASLAAAARHNLGMALARLGDLEGGWQEEQRAMEELASQGNRRLAGLSSVYLARMALDRGDGALAEERSHAAIGIFGEDSLRPYALAALARAQLLQGRKEDALTTVREAVALVDASGKELEGEAFVRLAHADILVAVGRLPDAREAVALAGLRVRERAGKIADEALRASFVQNVPENAGILSLLESLLGGNR